MRKFNPLWAGLLVFAMLGVTMLCTNCASDDFTPENKTVYPPLEGVETSISSYFPDSGGIATKLILNGRNFGTDTAYIKVTVNGKNAAVIGSDGEAIYAIVPVRADTGLVRAYIGKGDNTREFTYDKPFNYQFLKNVTTEIGQTGLSGTDDGAYSEAKLRRPWFVTFDSEGKLFLIDEGRGVDSDGALRVGYNGELTTLMRNSSGPMQSPTALAFSPGQDTLYLVNSLWQANNMVTDAAVAILLRETGFITIKPYIRATYTRATAIAVHPRTGAVFYNSQHDGYLYRFNKTTQEGEQLYQLNGTDTELKMVFSPDGKTLYIMVKNKHCIYRANYNETTRTIDKPELWAGQWNSSGFENGLGTNAKFNEPGQGAVDDDGNLYIPDKQNHCIRKITPEGYVSTYAGVPGTSGFQDGDPAVCLFNLPEAVAFSPIDDGLYVADRGNHLVRKIMVE
ncbi:SMP-30/gluconolactonase/LRE family protein [Gaoshiqia sp. Z1-71]|uniref:SMP-30/gluconolactonase/LRE family protein n=1 Tax=Gaoshiqia hydrogeniformans TaxID=3290090 RepID=UPI003BF8ACDF